MDSRLALCLVLATFGCAPSQGQAPWPDAETRRASAIPLVEVATSAPEAEFSDVTDLAVDSRGTVHVGDWYRQRVTVLSPTGALVRFLGRKGSGPGEFQSIRGVQVLPGDSLLVYDPVLARISVYAPGEAAPAYVGNLGARLEGGAPFFLWRTRSGDAFVAYSRPGFRFGTGEEAAPRVDAVSILAADGSTRSERVLAFPSRAFLVARTSVTPNPFGREGIVRLDARDRLYYVWTDSAVVRTMDVTGRPLGGFSVPHQAPEVTAGDAAEQLDLLGDWGKRTFGQVLRDSLPRRWPAVKGFLIDDADRLWLGLTGPRGEPTEWAAFTAAGEYRASILVPDGVEVLAIRGGRVYGVRKDEMDVPRVVVLSLGQGVS